MRNTGRQARKTTFAGFPAFQAGDLALLYTKVAKQAPGAFDKTLIVPCRRARSGRFFQIFHCSYHS